VFLVFVALGGQSGFIHNGFLSLTVFIKNTIRSGEYKVFVMKKLPFGVFFRVWARNYCPWDGAYLRFLLLSFKG